MSSAVPGGADAHGRGSPALLEVRGLRKAFGGLKVTDGISFDLEAGVLTTLVGPNGAGKTTLFNQITGELAPDAGSIRLRGESLLGLAPWRVARRGVARSFQDLRLFTHMSARDNLLTTMEPATGLWQPGGAAARQRRLDRVAELLAATRLDALASARAIDLSYAQRKFLSLARVMAADASVWLLDEPASGLDRGSYALFLQLVCDAVRGGVTVCMIEHNLDIVSSASDRVLFLDRGRLLAEGSPAEVLNDPALAAIYFGERAA
ncbi:MAG: ABC transporter ATP-binding protein [Burkholderiaceae bacterium]|nr:ABC transporter ATP-binding protein [Burkholderiaceae bacterium]